MSADSHMAAGSSTGLAPTVQDFTKDSMIGSGMILTGKRMKTFKLHEHINRRILIAQLRVELQWKGVEDGCE